MPSPELAALFRMRPERAADYLAAKGLRLTGPYWTLDGPQHSRVFTVANLAKLDVLADIMTALQEAIDTGQTERWTKERLVPLLQQKGWWGPTVAVDPDTGEARMVQQGSLRRLQTIYRTNLQSAYMAGRHRQAMAEIDRAPYAQYLAVRDSRTRPAHAALHGRVFRLDSPEWSVISPPNGYNCRCRARYLSERELTARGLTPETDVRILEREPPGRRPVDPQTGETPARWIQRGVSVPDPLDPNGRAVLYPDPRWDHLPGSDGAERAIVDRLMEQATLLGNGVRELVLADLLRNGVQVAALPQYVAATSAALGPPEITLTIAGRPSKTFVASVRATLDAIPPAARMALRTNLPRVVVSRTLTGARPDLKGVQPRGWPDGTTWDNADGCETGGRAYVAERYRDHWSKGNPWTDSRRTAYVVQHELGHAIDHAFGRISEGADFRAAYEADIDAAAAQQLQLGAYFTQAGDAGPSETFAEQFYHVVAGKGDMSMPNTYAFVRALIGMGGDAP